MCNARTCKGVARGEGGKSSPPPPETEKIVVENGVISEGSIFSNKFSKNSLKFHFSIEFSSKISKFSQIFPIICVFRPNAQKSNAWFVTFFEKYAKIMHFRNFRKKLFSKFSKSVPPSKKSWLRPHLKIYLYSFLEWQMFRPNLNTAHFVEIDLCGKLSNYAARKIYL